MQALHGHPAKGVVQLVLALICVCGAQADDLGAHRNDRRLRGYPGAPPRLTPAQADRLVLAHGMPVFSRITLDDERGGLGAVIFRVDAPVAVVWSVIADFGSYPLWVEGVDETEVYRTENDDIYVRFKVHHWLGGSYTYYAKHTFSTDNGWVTWRLDYDHASDFDDSVGFWRVAPVPGDPAQSDVTYSAELLLKQRVPGFIKRRVARKGLEQTADWVRQQAQARARATGE